MANIRFKGLEEYEKKLSRLGQESERIAGAAIYEGAKVMADAIKSSIQSLPVVRGYGTEERPLPGGVTSAQKQGLINGFGISSMQKDNGYYNVKIGFDGYNNTKTKAYPQGQPNQLVARGVESGTSWKQKYPFVRPAVNKSRKATEKRMEEILDREIEKLMK